MAGVEDKDNQSEEAIDGQDIFYVSKKTLETLKEKIKKEEEITQDMLNDLTFPDKLADEEIMTPVDMRGVGQEVDDVEELVSKLGTKGAAEAFIKAKEYFDANKDGEADDERPKEMTAAEWKQVLAEEEDMLEGEEEDMLEDEEESVGDDEEGEEEAEAAEPAAKKAKTS